MTRSHVLDIYGVNVHLATSKRDWKQLRKELPFVGKVPKSMGQTQFACTKLGGIVIQAHLVLWVDINAHANAASLVDTCAHESAHAADRIVEWIGHTPMVCDEPTAYLVGWLTSWMWDGINA